MKTIKNSFCLKDSELEVLAVYLRKRVFEICLKAHNGHIGGSSGAVELMTALYFGGFVRLSLKDPSCPKRDRVLVRGHLGPIRYPILSLLGFIMPEELDTYRQFGSRLHGHEDHQEVPGVDITPSGSLGMILSYGVGSALVANKRQDPFTTFVFLGDGEEQEGNVSEAARHAAQLRLKHLVVVIDCNGKQLSDPVIKADTSNLALIWKGYGWNVIKLPNGHDISDIRRAYTKALKFANDGPVVIIANTSKGVGLKEALTHFSGYHTISTCKEGIVMDAIHKQESMINYPLLAKVLRKIGSVVGKSSLGKSVTASGSNQAQSPEVLFDIQPLATTPNNPDLSQADYFRQLGSIWQSKGLPKGYFLSADVTRRDHVKLLQLSRFARYMNTGIREQHTIAMAHGLSITDPKARIIINSLDAFTYRAIDQINAMVQGGGRAVIIADVAGLSNSRNGRTHQSSGQPGAILMMPGIVFLEPWDVVDTFNCLNWAIGHSTGVVFVRIHSSWIDVRVQSSVNRNIDHYCVFEPTTSLQCSIVASGLTVSSAIKAARTLDQEGVGVQVINVINHKRIESIDFPPGKPVLTVYNGNPHILQSIVAMQAMRSSHAPSRVDGIGFEFGTTGDISELVKKFQLDEHSIVRKIRSEFLR